MNLEKTSFIGLLILVTLAFFALLADFAQPVFWAATLAVIFHPVYTACLSRVRGRKSVAALITLVVICVTVIIPLWFILSAVVDEAALLYAQIQSGELNIEQPLDWMRANLPAVTEILNKAGITVEEIKEDISNAVVVTSQFIGSLAITAGQGAVRFAVMFVLMLYILFFFLRDGDDLIETLIHALPLGDARERALMSKFAEVSRATIKGTLVIGLVQGFLGGVIFAVLGIQAAVFWGCVMVVLSVIPVVGASLIWVPAAIGLGIAGDYVSAFVLVAFGAVVIGLVDNFLRPILVGRDTRMPDYLVLLSTLGGLSVFGASGIVIGPLVASLFLTMWLMFATEFNDTEGALLYTGRPDEESDDSSD
jgi:predicted PurR-regulated permease PerM